MYSIATPVQLRITSKVRACGEYSVSALLHGRHEGLGRNSCPPLGSSAAWIIIVFTVNSVLARCEVSPRGRLANVHLEFPVPVGDLGAGLVVSGPAPKLAEGGTPNYEGRLSSRASCATWTVSTTAAPAPAPRSCTPRPSGPGSASGQVHVRPRLPRLEPVLRRDKQRQPPPRPTKQEE